MPSYQDFAPGGRAVQPSTESSLAPIDDMSMGAKSSLAQKSQDPASSVDSDLAGTVLYIEDDLVSVRLLEAVVQALFPRVELVHAPTASCGISLIRNQAYDLVLLDMRLPDMSGLDVVRELNPEISNNRVRVVLLTAGKGDPDTFRALALGALECWDKPLDLNVFALGLGKYLHA